jgi:hypothetical protein
MWCVGPQTLAEPVEAAATRGADAPDGHVECERDVRIAVVLAVGEGAQQCPTAQREDVEGTAYEVAALVCLHDGFRGVDFVGWGGVEPEVVLDDFATRTAQQSQGLVARGRRQPTADCCGFAQAGQ